MCLCCQFGPSIPLQVPPPVLQAKTTHQNTSSFISIFLIFTSSTVNHNPVAILIAQQTTITHGVPNPSRVPLEHLVEPFPEQLKLDHTSTSTPSQQKPYTSKAMQRQNLKALGITYTPPTPTPSPPDPCRQQFTRFYDTKLPTAYEIILSYKSQSPAIPRTLKALLGTPLSRNGFV